MWSWFEQSGDKRRKLRRKSLHILSYKITVKLSPCLIQSLILRSEQRPHSRGKGVQRIVLLGPLLISSCCDSIYILNPVSQKELVEGVSSIVIRVDKSGLNVNGV